MAPSEVEIEENNGMGKTRDLFKKIRDTKGTFHASSVQFSCSVVSNSLRIVTDSDHVTVEGLIRG